MNFPRSQGNSQWQGQDFNCDLSPVWCPFLFTAAASSSQDLVGPRVIPTERDMAGLPGAPGHPDKQNSDLGVEGRRAKEAEENEKQHRTLRF